jgi:hypothetical protein
MQANGISLAIPLTPSYSSAGLTDSPNGSAGVLPSDAAGPPPPG